MIRKTRPLIVFAGTLILGIFFKNDFIRFLIGFELILFLAAFWETRYLAGRVSGELWLDQNIVPKNKTFPLKVRIKNNAFFPVPELFVRVALKVFPDQEEVLLTGKVMLDGREEGAVVFSMDSRYCGCMEVRLERIMVQDHLGFFQKKIPERFSQPKLLFFFPDSEENINDLLGLDILPEGEEGSDIHRNRSGEDFTDIRVYQNGDLFKLVHWKLSARMNDLIVKELGKTGEQVYWIYLNLEDPSREAQKGTATRDRRKWDRFFEHAGAVTLALLQADQSFLAVWINSERGQVEQYLVTDEESRREMLCALLHTDSYLPGKDREIVKELPLNEMETEIIEISLQGDLTSRPA